MSQQQKSTVEIYIYLNSFSRRHASLLFHSLKYSNQIIYENICTGFLPRISACQPKMNWHHNARVSGMDMRTWIKRVHNARAFAPPPAQLIISGCGKTAAAIWQPNINTFKILIGRHNFNWLLLATTNCHFMCASCFLSVNYHLFSTPLTSFINTDLRFSYPNRQSS